MKEMFDPRMCWMLGGWVVGMVTALRIAFMYLLEPDEPASSLMMRSTMTEEHWDRGVFSKVEALIAESWVWLADVEVCVTWNPLLERYIRQRPESWGKKNDVTRGSMRLYFVIAMLEF